MFRSRKKTLLFFLTALICCLMLRLFYIQIYKGSKLSKTASVQRLSSSVLEVERGNILDKNSIPLVNRTTSLSIVLQPLILRKDTQTINKICNILNLDYFRIKTEIETENKPIVISIDKSKESMLKGLNDKGVSIVHYLSRYSSDTIARHIIGYLNGVDKTGEVGIEKFYDDVLNYGTQKEVGLVTDAWKNPLEGLGYRLIDENKSDRKLQVKLTLDYHIQKIVEDVIDSTVIDKAGIKGAVVVEDICTGDIIAISSKPDYDQNKVNDYLSSPNKELFNRAVASYNLGSIFKIIDTAEAIETNINLKGEFFCPGFIKIGDKVFKCESYSFGGHGIVNLTSAFAKSCNPYFIQLGLKIGYKNIISMAKKFGLGNFTGIKEQGIDESRGSLPNESSSYTFGDIANLSIGQGKVMATPLQVADVVATIANGGIKNKVNIVDSLVDENGNVVKEVKRSDGERIISKETSDIIRGLMEEVVTNGTGKNANLEKYGGAAGKTGSAEAGIGPDGKKITHAWFAGYFPRVNPKYSISVFVEDGKRGGAAAAPIFEKIAEEIMKKGF